MSANTYFSRVHGGQDLADKVSYDLAQRRGGSKAKKNKRMSRQSIMSSATKDAQMHELQHQRIWWTEKGIQIGKKREKEIQARNVTALIKQE